MSTSGGYSAVPPGWYPDPAGTGRFRWWDGSTWTDQFSTPQVPGTYGGQAPGTYGSAPYAPQRPLISSGTPVYNPLIWIMTLMPLLTILVLLFWNPNFRVIYIGSEQNPTVDPSSIFTPAYFLLIFSGFLTYAATVLLAYFDSERLKRDGVVRPFHWAWSFLSGAVYVIGRSVIVGKVAPGRGLAPIWVLIGVVFLSFVVTTMKMSALMSSMIESIPS
ncbi:MAG TPA: DUF2510 domain-containing protein [Arthrobacter sp.]|nr:DUF2510 domain-containing protein [Arthrobacter sp.]